MKWMWTVLVGLLLVAGPAATAGPEDQPAKAGEKAEKKEPAKKEPVKKKITVTGRAFTTMPSGTGSAVMLGGSWEKLPPKVKKAIIEELSRNLKGEELKKAIEGLRSGKGVVLESGAGARFLAPGSLKLGGAPLGSGKARTEVRVKVEPEGGALPPGVKEQVLKALKGSLSPEVFDEVREALEKGRHRVHVVREGARFFPGFGMRGEGGMPGFRGRMYCRPGEDEPFRRGPAPWYRRPRCHARRGPAMERPGELLEAIRGLTDEIRMLRMEMARHHAAERGGRRMLGIRPGTPPAPKKPGASGTPSAPKKLAPPPATFRLQGASGGTMVVPLRRVEKSEMEGVKRELQKIREGMQEFEKRLAELRAKAAGK